MEIRIKRPPISELAPLLALSPIAEHRHAALLSGADFIGLVAGNGVPIGYAQLALEHGTWTVELAVHPDHREGGMPTALLTAALGAARGEGAKEVAYWQTNAGDWSDGAATAAGFEIVREVVQLRVPLPLHVAAESDLELRPFQPGADEAAWLAINAQAFADHPDQGAWTEDDLVRREAEPWFDATGFLVLEIDGRMAGSCWTKVHADGPLGEIYVISVDPTFHRRGYGKVLVLAGLDHLARSGMPTGMLYTESTNEGALALYGSLGFKLHHVDRSYTAIPIP